MLLSKAKTIIPNTYSIPERLYLTVLDLGSDRHILNFNLNILNLRFCEK